MTNFILKNKQITGILSFHKVYKLIYNTHMVCTKLFKHALNSIKWSVEAIDVLSYIAKVNWEMLYGNYLLKISCQTRLT